MNASPNKRQSPRVPVSFLVRCGLGGIDEMWGEAANLSTGGIGIGINHPLATREKLEVDFLLPEKRRTLSMKGEVVWCQFHYDSDSESRTLFTAGIKFLDLGQPERSLLEDCVLRLLQERQK
ncbi:MAG: PilZ domain-containing protein [Deltaproteobacteria bacterium]|nr:PilZ domain-containing protein [Deltaproteobacteria bacterium]MBW2071203.1 PilZ domain-containing protein [Deltaproteobacteria bacterium]